MRLKCLFCKYKSVCIPEQESHLSNYQKLQKKYLDLLKSYGILNQQYDELYVNYENLKFNLQTFIRENDK